MERESTELARTIGINDNVSDLTDSTATTSSHNNSEGRTSSGKRKLASVHHTVITEEQRRILSLRRGQQVDRIQRSAQESQERLDHPRSE